MAPPIQRYTADFVRLTNYYIIIINIIIIIIPQNLVQIRQ